jgi:glycosyltransferase involved in cell wall biosynthesis
VDRAPDAEGGQPDTGGVDVIALIPAYQEAPRVGGVVTAARALLPVLVVDDGSTDGTADAARAAGADVIAQVPNRGKGAALRLGFRAAADRGARAVVTLDADGQHDPAELRRFLDAWTATGADLVIGRRDFRAMPAVRRLANTLGGLALTVAIGRPVPDNQSGYRLVSRRLMAQLERSAEAGFEFEVEMIAVAVREGWAIEWVPISTIYAGEPSHIRPLHHLSNYLRVVRAARRIVRSAPVGTPGARGSDDRADPVADDAATG